MRCGIWEGMEYPARRARQGKTTEDRGREIEVRRKVLPCGSGFQPRFEQLL